MNNYFTNNKKIFLMILQSVFILVASLFVFNGCSDTIKGEINDNLKPIVQFVNIPPEGQQFSRNPEIFWIGTDPDGLIDFYRYHIGIEDDVLAAGGPLAYANALLTTDWTQIEINQTESDPHTANVLPFTADTLDPVSNPVGQYVFLQAYDREGLGSDIAYRLFRRNDNPPETQIFNIGNDTPYVNSIFEGGVVTGVRMKWQGFDRKDYDDIGLTPPPFDFEWKLYGPFVKDSIDYINSNLIEDVFVTVDAKILHVDDLFITCATIDVDTVINGDSTTVPIEVCDTVVFDQLFFDTALNTPFYAREQILQIDDSTISSQYITGSFNGVDEWVQNTSDTIFNVFRNNTPDTTVELSFIFWIRSRDDAFVKDLTPEFVSFPVINPKYERDIAIIDFTGGSKGNYIHKDTAKAFWYNTIKNWKLSRTTNSDTIFDLDTSVFTNSEAPVKQAGKTGIDYIFTSAYRGESIPLNILLKHKVLILYNESFDKSAFAGANSVSFPEILSAMDAKINVWATWRNPLNVNLNDIKSQVIPAPADYKRYFGVEFMTYSSWFFNAISLPGTSGRNEDFIGTYSIDETRWPAIDIDTSLLHSRFKWPATAPSTVFLWEDSLAALPEVNWTARSFGTEVMYLYKSKYGANNPFGHEYEGSPVGHRFQTSLFRTVHFNFTLLTMDTLQAQTISNDVINWLYDPSLGSNSVFNDNRYNDAAVKINVDDARRRYGERLLEQSQLRLNVDN